MSNQQTSTHKKHNTSASSSSSSYASNTGGYKATSHTSGEGRGGFRAQRSGSYVASGRSGGGQHQRGGGQGSRGGRGRGGGSHHHHRPPTTEGSTYHTHSNTTMANPTEDVASSNTTTSNNIPSSTSTLSTHQPHHHHHPPHHHQQQLPSIRNSDLAATIGRTSSAPPTTGDHNTTTQHPTRIPEHKAHKIHPPQPQPQPHVYTNTSVMMVPAGYGYYSSQPYYYPQQRSSGSSEIVKPQSSKITIVDPNSGSVVDLKEEKTTATSDNTSSSTTATSTSTTIADTTKQQPPSTTASKDEVMKPVEPSAVEATTGKKEETIEQTPAQSEPVKLEEPAESKPEITTASQDNVGNAENRTEQVSDQKVLEPQTPTSEYGEQTPTAEDSSATFESSQDKIDEDKVVKEDPNEIEGFEDSEEEPEDEESDKTKIYSRDQLLRFKDSCTEPPEKLKSLEIFQSSLKSTGGAARGGRGATLPGARPGFNISRGGGRGAQRGGTPGAPTRGRGGKDVKQTTRRAPEKLQKSQNALKLAKDKSKEEMIVDEVKFILNRLTPENYDKLKVEFLGACRSKPGDEEVLNAIIDQIFSYAISLQNFSALYARLCADLSTELKEKIGEENTKQFKRLLLNKCQREFEKEKEEELKNASEKLSPEELEEKEFLLRKKKVGNVIFIGELYLQEMLSEKIMHEVIKRLLINPTPHPSSDDIELLCKLLTTIGKKLDHEKSKKYVNFYFARMETLSQEPTIASRLRFMLRDVIEMRLNDWVARIEKTKATKTRQEAREEAVKQQMDQIKKLEKHHHLRKPNNKPKASYVTKQSGALQAERYRKMDSKKTLAPGGGIVKQAPASTQGKTDANTFALLEEEEKEEEISEEEPVEDTQQVASEVEEEEETEEQISTITERTKKLMSCYFEEGEIDETLETIEKENLHKTKYFIRGVAFAACENSKENEISDTVKLLKKLKEGPITVVDDILIYGFIRYFTQIVEESLYIDIPELFQYSGKFLGRLIFEKVLSFSNLYDVLLTVVLDEENPLQESHVFEVLEHLYDTICSECEFNDNLKKPVQHYQEELENHLVLAEIEEGKHLVNNSMDLMDIFKPNGESYAKLCSFIEEKCYGCFEPSIYYNKCINEREKSQLSDFIAVLSDEQILSGILHAKCHEDPVSNVEEFKEILLEEVREKLEEGYEVSLIGTAQHACCTRAKFDRLKPLLNLLVEMKLLNPSHVSQYISGDLQIDQPGYEQVKPFLQ
ncbi:hypothetical protein C9374_010295 [Naegleria lovaniensis]|uniref:MI domain-containing protein n=1 Tax=Naegleria lovaniensis TaxID=51637 RepID=A0AA88GE81_NAELO|nr:uncharacterized protein C9374_010295 [Naegleria lovaniensis]KAG2374921.1 hypothetical protein C9374_010295 [Naegleria lovaniensis]